MARAENNERRLVDQVTGTVHLEDATTVQFQMSAVGISRWGAPTGDLGDTVDATEAMREALVRGGHLGGQPRPAQPPKDPQGTPAEWSAVADLLHRLTIAEAELKDGKFGPQTIAMMACVRAYRLAKDLNPSLEWVSYRAGYLAGMEVR